MQLTRFLALATTIFSSLTLAQTPAPASSCTGATPSQTSVFSAAVLQYASELKDSPAATSLGLALLLNGHGDAIQSLTQNIAQFVPSGTSLDLCSLATDPPTMFPTLAWESELSDNLRSDIKSIETSAALHIASLDQSVLGISMSLSSPTPSPTDNQGRAARQTAAAGLMGAAGVAVGAAAVFL